MTNLGDRQIRNPSSGRGRLHGRWNRDVREPRDQSRSGKSVCARKQCGDRRLRSLHRTVFAVVLSAILSASAAPQLYAQTYWDVEASTNSLTLIKGETITYDLRLSLPPTDDDWWIVVLVDGVVRDSGDYKGLRWIPSVGREFDRSDWSQDSNNNPLPVPGPWRDISIQVSDTDDVVPGTTVTFTHEVRCPKTSHCPVGNSATVTMTIEGVSGDDTDDGDGDTDDGDGNTDDGDGNTDDGDGNTDDGDGNTDDGDGDTDDGDGDTDDGDGNTGGDDGAGERGGNTGDDGNDDNDGVARSSRNTVGWLRSFGARASTHVLDAVDDRMQCARSRRFGEASPGHGRSGWRCGPRDPRAASLVIGGRRLLGGVTRADDSASQRHVAHAYPDWPGHDETRIERNSFASRSLTAESLAGSSFQFSSGARDAARSFHLWGRGSYSRFDDRHGVLRLDGDVRSMTLGAEFGGDRVLTGVALSHSVGSGSHFRGGGESESTLAGIYPYAHFGVNERLRVWGTLGAGSGELTRSVHDGETVRTGLSMRMAAVGGRTTLRSATAEDRLSLAVDTDALLTRIRSEEGDHLMAGEADASRLRVGLEGSYAIVNDDGELAPYVDVGVRHDAGAGATGLGVEIGGGIRFTHPLLDLTTEFGVHGLVAHEADDRSEWGASGSIRYDPHSNTGRGPSFRLASSWGAESTGGSGALLRRETVSDWLSDGGSDVGVGIDAEFGYGIPLRNGAGTGTPWVGASLTERRTDVRLGYRLEFGRSAGVGVEGLIRDGTQDGVPSDHALMLRLSLR